MALNWTPEVLVDLLVGSAFLIGGLFSFKTSSTNKIKTLFYLRLVWFSLSAYFFMEGFSYLLLSTLLARIFATIAIPATVFLIIAINYNLKDSFNSISLILIFSLGTLLCYFAFQPDAAQIVVEDGYYTIIWTGWFNIIGILFLFIFACFFFYWALRTWINAPYEIKQEASIFLLGAIIAGIVSHSFYFMIFWIPSFILLANISVLIGLSICNIIIRKEPKILYILPFTPYKVFVYDFEGFLLFDYNWSESKTSEYLVSNLKSITQNMNREVINLEGFLDIKLKEGILILHNSKLITVGLVISKSSKLLKDSVSKFSAEFEEKFEVQLKEPFKDASMFNQANYLIEKYFSIFPSRIIRNKKQSLLISTDLYNLPQDLDKRLKEIFRNEEEYDFIKNEFQRSPKSLHAEFLTLFDEVTEEIEHHKEKEQLNKHE